MIVTDYEWTQIQRIVKLEKSKHPDWIYEDHTKKSIIGSCRINLLVGHKTIDKVKRRERFFSKTVLVLEPETNKEWPHLRLRERNVEDRKTNNL